MKNYPVILILIFTLWTFYAYAQYDEVLGNQLIKKTVSKYRGYDSYKVDFKYIFENRMDDEKDSQNGVFYVKGNKFRIDLDNQLIITDEKNIWTYMKEANEAQVSVYDPDDLEFAPDKIFTMWDKDYLAGYAGIYKVGERLTKLVELTPNDKSLNYYKVKMFIDKNTGEIVKLQTFYKNQGIIVTFDIKETKSNIPLNDKLFIFDKSRYPGVNIIDLRE